MLINIGRLLMLCVWGFLILNLVHPFPRPLNIFVNVALIFTVLMHGMQLALLKSTLPKDGPQMTTAEKVRIFLFGVFELLVWQKKFKVKKITLLFAYKADKARSFIAQRTFSAHCQGVVLLGVEAKRLLHSSALRFEACLIAHTGACRSHFLLARTAIVNRFFPLVAHHHQLLLERSHIIISFFPSLLHKTKRCGDDN